MNEVLSEELDGTRRFRRAYIEQGKGAGKSPLAAGVGMYCLLADGEPRAEVYAAASMKSQAMVLFRDAVAMWQQSGELRDRLTPSGGNPIWNLTTCIPARFFGRSPRRRTIPARGRAARCAMKFTNTATAA
jgi:terminase large subunit-like protein